MKGHKKVIYRSTPHSCARMGINFASNTVGNLFSGGSGLFFKTVNQQVIANTGVRTVINGILGNTMEGIGQISSNAIENKLTKKKP